MFIEFFKFISLKGKIYIWLFFFGFEKIGHFISRSDFARYYTTKQFSIEGAMFKQSFLTFEVVKTHLVNITTRLKY